MVQSDRSRYLVFAGEFRNEPLGGMRDLKKRYRILAEAKAWLDGYVEGKGSLSWGHIWDQDEGKEVYNAEGQ